MSKIVDYQIVQASLLELKDKVIEQMDEGWQPIGGITIHFSNSPGFGIPGGNIAFQAMVKYENVKVTVSDVRVVEQ